MTVKLGMTNTQLINAINSDIDLIKDQGSKIITKEFPASETETVSIQLDKKCQGKDYMFVFMDSGILEPSKYSLSSDGLAVNFSPAIPANHKIIIRYFTPGSSFTNYVTDEFQSNLLNYTTNRILEIPQDIKLEINNGNLTLKAGSKLRRLTGEEWIVKKDYSLNTSYYGFSQTCLIIPGSTDNGVSLTNLETPNISICSSGTTIPTSTTTQYHWFFKTDTKEYYWTHDNGATWERRAYAEFFPIAIAKVGAEKWTSIEQIFNGFGYIGSTAFALPGVKYQFADGRNEDGTYKSITKTFDKVSLTSYSYQIKDPYRQPLSINDQGILIRTDKYFIQNNQPVSSDSVWYKPETNETFRSNGSGVYGKSREIIIVNGISTNSAFNITSFEPLEVPTINSYQRAELAGMSMPSDKYIDLTLGASGTKYTAPANGTVLAIKRASAVGQNLGLKRVSSNIFFDFAWSSVANSNIFVNMDVRKGEVFDVSYTASGTEVQILRFYYAEGCQ